MIGAELGCGFSKSMLGQSWTFITRAHVYFVKHGSISKRSVEKLPWQARQSPRSRVHMNTITRNDLVDTQKSKGTQLESNIQWLEWARTWWRCNHWYRVTKLQRWWCMKQTSRHEKLKTAIVYTSRMMEGCCRGYRGYIDGPQRHWEGQADKLINHHWQSAHYQLDQTETELTRMWAWAWWAHVVEAMAYGGWSRYWNIWQDNCEHTWFTQQSSR